MIDEKERLPDLLSEHDGAPTGLAGQEIVQGGGDPGTHLALLQDPDTLPNWT